MTNWYMVTLVGRDAPGIVAGATQALFQNDCNLGETAMNLLGGNFTIMMMVESALSEDALADVLQSVVDAKGLRLHIDAIESHLHELAEPDVHVSVYGSDRAGIITQVTSVLADAGLNILDLGSDVGGTEESPLYIMSITGQALKGIDALQDVAQTLSDQDFEIHIEAVQTLIG
jgi:glycine cleavage system transcriptional repressor